MSVYDKMSGPETEVSQFLEEIGVWWRYENPLCVRDKGDRLRLCYPDFHLVDLGQYVEVCGSEEFEYEDRRTLYKENDCPVIFVEFFKETKWRYYLLQRIQEIHEMRKNKIESALKTAKEKGHLI